MKGHGGGEERERSGVKDVPEGDRVLVVLQVEVVVVVVVHQVHQVHQVVVVHQGAQVKDMPLAVKRIEATPVHVHPGHKVVLAAHVL